MQFVFVSLTIVSVFAAFSCSLLSFKHHNTLFRIVFFQLALACSTESTGLYMLLNHIENTWLFNLYILPSTVLLGIACVQLFGSPLAKKIGYAALALWLATGIAYLLHTGLTAFASKLFLSASALLIIFYIYALVNLIFLLKRDAYFNATFMLCIAILLYYGCNIPGVGLLSYMIKTDMATARVLYRINLIMCDVQYIIISVCYYSLYSRKLQPTKVSTLAETATTQ